MKKQERVDLSDWVIHFVHDRIPQDFSEWYLADSEGEIVNFIPSYFDFDNKPCYISEEMIDEEYPIDEDASAINVLMKILHDGYIRSGWAFRKNRPTIYGPFSAVCFTEMPLGSLIHYARKRNKYVGTYGIALKRNELFGVGGRQVIYGLSTQHIETDTEDLFLVMVYVPYLVNVELGLKSNIDTSLRIFKKIYQLIGPMKENGAGL